MGKGNLFLGHGRGKMGNMVFTRQGGKQVFKTLNDHPNNPRSNGQQSQRAKFANANKFYSRGVQNLFKFAYEDKRQGETDFNAFMRHNISNARMISKPCMEDANYPALGNFLMSKGSLTACRIEANNEDFSFGTEYADSKGLKSFGKWCQEFIEGTNYRNNDIVTVVVIQGCYFYKNNDLPLTEPDPIAPPPEWKIKQFRLDVNSNESAVAVLNAAGFDESKETECPCVPINSSLPTGAAIIVSRETKNKLLVSTSRIQFGSDTLLVYQRMDAKEYKEECLLSWGASDPAILQGQIVDFTFG